MSEELTASVLRWAKPALVGEWVVAVKEDPASNVKWSDMWSMPLSSFAALAATVATTVKVLMHVECARHVIYNVSRIEEWFIAMGLVI